MKQVWTLERLLPWVFIVAGTVGLFAAFMLTLDTFKLQADPNYHPSCSINPIISCGSVMKTDEAHTFGFPNPFLGLAAFGSLLTIGISMLAGAKFKRWFWLGIQAGTTAGLAFVVYLFYNSVYVIGALCPYCMAVWVVTMATFWYVLLYNLEIRTFSLPLRIASFVRKHHTDIYIGWLLVVASLILHHFWYYFGRSFS